MLAPTESTLIYEAHTGTLSISLWRLRTRMMPNLSSQGIPSPNHRHTLEEPCTSPRQATISTFLPSAPQTTPAVGYSSLHLWSLFLKNYFNVATHRIPSSGFICRTKFLVISLFYQFILVITISRPIGICRLFWPEQKTTATRSKINERCVSHRCFANARHTSCSI